MSDRGPECICTLEPWEEGSLDEYSRCPYHNPQETGPSEEGPVHSIAVCKWCLDALAEGEVHKPTRPFYACETNAR